MIDYLTSLIVYWLKVQTGWLAVLRRVLLTALFGPLLGGCDWVEQQYMEARFKNTARITAWCIKNHQETAELAGISAQTYCGRQHSVTRSNPSLGVTGGFSCPFGANHSRYFQIGGTNDSNWILTSMQVTMRVEDKFHTSYRKDLWIAPGSSIYVELEFKETMPCNIVLNSSKDSMWSWSNFSVGTIEASLQ